MFFSKVVYVLAHEVLGPSDFLNDGNVIYVPGVVSKHLVNQVEWAIILHYNLMYIQSAVSELDFQCSSVIKTENYDVTFCFI